MNRDGLDRAKLAAARLWAVTRLPYLSRALFAATVVPAPHSGTIAVDRRWQVHADPTVVEQLTVEHLGQLLIHLTAHLIRDHAPRAETAGVDDRTRARWNRAADAEINDDLVRDDCVPAAAGDLPTDLGCPPNRLAEAYLREGRDGPRRWDCGSGADALHRPWDGAALDGARGLDLTSISLLQLGLAADVQRQHNRQPGTVAGGWLRWAEALLPSRTDWRRVLAAEIRSAVAAVTGSVDYTYRRPSRRAHLSPHIVLPSMYRPVPEVAVICDTSGSMHAQLLAAALAEIEALLTRAGLRAEHVRVLTVDTTVHTAGRVRRATQLELGGGGGTDMGAGIIAATALRPRPSLVIVLTDGYTPWPQHPPPGIRVVVGLLGGQPGEPEAHSPAWARTVCIAEPALD